MSNKQLIPEEQPTDVRTLKILIDGEQINDAYQIESVLVYKEVNRIPYARITIIDGDAAKQKFEISDSQEFDPGKSVEIQAGYNSKDKTIFKGVIVRQGVRIGKNRNSILKLEAKDEFVGLCVGRKSEYFYKSKDSATIKDILKQHKTDFEANIKSRKYSLKTKVSDTEVEHDEMIQYNASDWDFIVTRAEKNGMLVFVNDGELTVAAPKIEEKPSISLSYGNTIFEFESEVDALSQYGSVESISWNMADQKLAKMTSGEPTLNKQGKLDGESLSGVVGSKKLEMRHSGNIKDKELQQWADSKLLKSRLARLRGRVKSQGFSGVKPGDSLELLGVGDHFNGGVFVSGVRHMISDENWEVDIQFGLQEDWFSQREDIVESGASGLVPAVVGLQVGIVTQLEKDPDSEFRMLVKSPMINDEAEGIWARVALLDAGENRGTFFRPEIGDEVVLGFLNGDPREAVVLGSLHSSSKKPSPIEPADDNDIKGIITRSNMRLIFDDKNETITIHTADEKNTVLLDNKNEGIFISDQHGNKIEMTSAGITLKSGADINLDAVGDIIMKGENIEGEGKASLKMAGNAGAELTSSASVVISGALVEIN